MKLLLLLLTALLLSACEGAVDVTPKLGNTSYTVYEREVFDCTINTVATDCVYGEGQLTCNADLFAYEFDTGAALLNDDSTQVVCRTVTQPRFDGAETIKPLLSL